MIVVKGLSKQFKGQTVLNGIDLTVQPGEVVAIIGPSGSGKTTFLRCLNLLETPSSGHIRVGDIEIDGDRPLAQQASLIRRLRQQVGFKHLGNGRMALAPGPHDVPLRADGETRHVQYRESVGRMRVVQ